MRNLCRLSLVTAALMASTAITSAADLIPHNPDPIPEVETHYSTGGWYIRGDIGYAHADIKDVTYTQGALLSGTFEQHELDSTWTIQGGIGYQATDYLRLDATVKWFGNVDFDGDSAPAGSDCSGGYGFFCDYDDNGSLDSATLLMANAYVDLGTYASFTPYVGAGIGGAYLKYGELINDQTCTGSADDATCSTLDFVHEGRSEWRFAYALHAGVSYDVTCRTKIDAGYTYTQIAGGRMFAGGFPVGGGGAAGGYGFDGGLTMHEGRIGLRYALDDSGCTPPTTPPPIVYK